MDEESGVTVDKQYTHENSKVGGCMQDYGVSESSKVSEKHGVSVPNSCASVPGQTLCGVVFNYISCNFNYFAHAWG